MRRDQREQDRDHVRDDADDPGRGGQHPGEHLDHDAQPDRAERRHGRRPGGPPADPGALGEVDPEHEADEQPDDRDHEEADHARARRRSTGSRRGTPASLSRRPGSRYFTHRAGEQQDAGDGGDASRPCCRRCRAPRPGSPRRPAASRAGSAPRCRPARRGSPGRRRPRARSRRHPATADRRTHPGTTTAPDHEGPGPRSRRVRARRRARWPGCRPACGSRRARGGDLAELVAVLARVVGAEEQLAAGLQLDAQVGLGPAAVAAVRSTQRGSTRGNGSGHFGLISLYIGVRCTVNVAAGSKDSRLPRGAGHVLSNHVRRLYASGWSGPREAPILLRSIDPWCCGAVLLW